MILPTDEYWSSVGKWLLTPISDVLVIDNGVQWRRALDCACQNGMVGPEFCAVHGNWCACSYPTADHVTQFNHTCGQCGKPVFNGG